MKTAVLIVSVVLTICAAHAQQPVITAISGNGQITWSNGNVHAQYRVEWASSMTGAWQRTWQNPGIVEADANGTVTANIPMFFRVVKITNETTTGMVLIEEGPFERGDRYGNIPWIPTGTLYISSFYMDRFEVSKSQWDIVRNWGLTNGYIDLGAGGTDTMMTDSNNPVVYVSWYDAVKWCNARSEMEGLVPVYYTWSFPIEANTYRTGQEDIDDSWVMWNNSGYRLPTEAEFEKAARGGLTGHHYPWPSFGGVFSDHIDNSLANYNAYFNGTAPIGYYNGGQIPVGRDMANGFGLYDMAGNVDEHVWDWYDPTFNYYTNYPSHDPHGVSTGTMRMSKSGSWGSTEASLKCANFNAHSPASGDQWIGFRCVRTVSD